MPLTTSMAIPAWLNRILQHHRVGDALSLSSGLLVPFAFAPFHFVWLVYPAFAVFFLCCLNITPKQAFWRGLLFGLAQFSWGLAWIYDSFNLYTHFSPFAIVAMTVLFVLLMSLYPGLAAYTAVRLMRNRPTYLLLAGLPACWLLAEWLRGIALTGFPWLLIGHSQVDTPLAGYAPLIGGLGVGYVVVLCCGLLALFLVRPGHWQRTMSGIVALWLGGWAVGQIDWHYPSGDAIRVSALQGNTASAVKWQPKNKQSVKDWYHEETQRQLDSDLIIWPETALPSYLHKEKDYIEALRITAQQHNTDILMGLLIVDFEEHNYTNSLINLKGGRYDKHHLVPIAEYFPLGKIPDWLKPWIFFPVSSITAGAEQQAPFYAAGQPIGASICFEIAYADEIRKSLPQATLLVNISDDEMYSHTLEPHQYHQIARMRAIESARYLVRAVSSGYSAIIGPKGRVEEVSSLGEAAVVKGRVWPLKGMTPYVYFGDWPLLLFSLGFLLTPNVFRKRTRSEGNG